MKKIKEILWGIVLVAVGLIWALNAIGLTDINIFFRGWWTLIIIIPCFIGLFGKGDKTGSIIGLIIGVAFLLASNELLDLVLVFKLIVPLVLVCIGLCIIFKDVVNKTVNDKIKQLNKSGLEEYYATFAGQKIDLTNETFKGCSLNAIFGGIEFSLKNAIVEGEQIINTSSIFGGIVITVPDGVNVKTKSTPIFGGVSNKVPMIKEENRPTIYINSLCLFGGVEVK